jgi:hypothetical protein
MLLVSIDELHLKSVGGEKCPPEVSSGAMDIKPVKTGY